jgi:hypothetical protein
MENQEELNALKVELYDAGKEVQNLRGVIGQIGQALGVAGEEMTIEGIINAAKAAAVVTEED